LAGEKARKKDLPKTLSFGQFKKEALRMMRVSPSSLDFAKLRYKDKSGSKVPLENDAGPPPMAFKTPS